MGAGADIYTFRHALLREAGYQELLPGERNRLHAPVRRDAGRGGRDGRRPRLPLVRRARSPECTDRVSRGWAVGRAALWLRRGPRPLRAVARAVGARGRRRGACRRRCLALTLRAAEVADLAGDHGRAAALIRDALPGAGDIHCGRCRPWERLSGACRLRGRCWCRRGCRRDASGWCRASPCDRTPLTSRRPRRPRCRRGCGSGTRARRRTPRCGRGPCTQERPPS